MFSVEAEPGFDRTSFSPSSRSRDRISPGLGWKDDVLLDEENEPLETVRGCALRFAYSHLADSGHRNPGSGPPGEMRSAANSRIGSAVGLRLFDGSHTLSPIPIPADRGIGVLLLSLGFAAGYSGFSAFQKAGTPVRPGDEPTKGPVPINNEVTSGEIGRLHGRLGSQTASPLCS